MGRPGRAQCGYVVEARRHTNGARAHRLAAGDVIGRVADDDDVRAAERASRELRATTRSDGRKIRTVMGIRAEGADHETRGIEARRAQLQSRPMLDISGAQSDEG